MDELLFQLLSRLGLELPPNEGQNPIAQALRTDPYTPDDEPYLRQYMGIPKDGGLTPTDLRPTKLAVKDSLPWYRPVENPMDTRKYKLPYAPADIDSLQKGETLTWGGPPTPGLGHYTASIGKGDTGRPFMSVYDKWDFDSPVVSPLMQQLMSRAGKGFHVYERYPLQKNPNGSYQVGGDIELPKE